MSAQQNLVPNGSFEDTVNCPSRAATYYIDACKHWIMPTTGSSDYFNACSKDFDMLLNRYEFKVPENYIGFQHARTGVAYSGFLYTEIFSDTSVEYSEYIQVKLIQPLQQGKTYKVTFYISNAEFSFGINSVGCYLSVNAPTRPDYSILGVIPQIKNDPAVFLDDTLNWTEISGKFVSKGNEQYLTIGNFYKYPNIKCINRPGNLLQYANAYYYVDDVSVVEIEEPVTIPNVFTPNGDGVNDTFRLDNVSNIVQLSIYNRWGLNVFQSDNRSFWDGNQSNGSPCIAETYYYIIHTETETYKGFIELIK